MSGRNVNENYYIDSKCDDESDLKDAILYENPNDSDPKSILSTSPGTGSKIQGMSLDLSMVADSRKNGSQSKGQNKGEKDEFDYDYNVNEQNLTVVFELPDGSQGENIFKLGHTVEYLKWYVEQEYGISMETQKLYYENVLMVDSFCLLDFPSVEADAEEIYIQVEGDLPSMYRK